ncbi:TMEM143 family protein [Pseudonocardia spinosispora]|uniref:TMEM143 family protein n=1 Tax=Pseudonocardia spinosispora TaxID=103441 RepID=UPI000417CE1B|nr:TMEM143 family protein [Pseudonocardia spinosispora]
MTDERFIPFRKTSIVEMCADEVPGPERESFEAFAELLASLLHHEFRGRLETLKDAYHPFNPGSDIRTIADTGPEERKAAQERLVDELTSLAEAANFERVSSEDLDRAFTEESLMKVRLEADFDDFEQVVFYRRGENSRTEEVKRLFGLRRRTIEFTNYAKVLVYVKFKDAAHFEEQGKKIDDLPFAPGSTIIKLFQDVPRADLEMLFPNARVRMRPIDKLLIGVPAVISGVIVVATKLIAALIPVLLLLGFWFGVHNKPVQLNHGQLLALGAGLAALGGYVVRQISTFKNRKIQFMKALSENLYFRNLDNDAGVFHHLLDSAEEEEVKEAVLAYHFLRRSEEPLSAEELDTRIERWFAEKWDASFDFEVDDGVGKLRRLQLIDTDEQERLTAVTLDEAKRRLDETWDNLFSYNAQPAKAEA